MSLLFGFDPVSLFLAFIISLVLWKFLDDDETARAINKIPGPKAYPLVGNIFEALESKEKTMEKAILRKNKFGPIIRLWIGRTPMVVVSEPEAIEVLLRSTKHSEKNLSYKFLYPWLGMGLLTSYGKQWSVHRKLITPAFHFQILQSFIEVFHENANTLVGKLKGKAETGEKFNIFPLVTLCALDIICETAMGTKIHAQSESQSEYVTSVYSLASLTFHRIRRIWLHPDFIFERTSSGRAYLKHLRIVRGFTENVIKCRRAALEAKKGAGGKVEGNDGRRQAFLDLLLDSSSEDASTPLTDEELRDEVETFMFEGHDTTAAAIAWTLFALGNHPNIQEDVYQEIKSIFEDDPTRSPTMNDLQEMKLLERVIRETLRLYPSVAVIGRITEEDVYLGKHLVPKGINIIVGIYSLHRDPKHYPEPEIFDPDRFLPENSFQRHPYSYIPFSAGPRNCIGQKFAILEEKAVLSALIRNFKFESMEKLEEKKKISELILRPDSGVDVKISKR